MAVKKQPSDFEVLDHMSGENLDICMCPDVIDVTNGKKNGTVKFGVPPVVAEKVINSVANVGREEYLVVMYVVNKKQFFATKEKLTQNGNTETMAG